MIETYINPEMQQLFGAVSEAGGDMTQVNGDSICPVLNMLNTKYFIFPLQGGQTVPIQNPYVYGNGWFVDQITYVDNANKEDRPASSGRSRCEVQDPVGRGCRTGYCQHREDHQL